jgi:hypothetical protein
MTTPVPGSQVLQPEYHYVRIEPHRGFDLVIVGGEDHKTGQFA